MDRPSSHLGKETTIMSNDRRFGLSREADPMGAQFAFVDAADLPTEENPTVASDDERNLEAAQ